MTEWLHTVDVSEYFHNASMTFPEKRDAIVATLANSSWLVATDHFSDLYELIVELSETTHPTDFDMVWDSVYDLADFERTWINTR